MTFSISAFRTALAGGSRPNLFNVTFTPPAGVTLGGSPTLLCKSAAVPGMTIGQIEVPFRGRRVKLPGDRTYAEWTATFINDQGHATKAGFESWINSIRSNRFADAANLGSLTDGYKGTIAVAQLDDNNKAVVTYTLADAFPTDISQIDLSYDSSDAIEEFSVTFMYSYHTYS